MRSAAYEEIGESPGIIHVGCWAHARRGFDEACTATKKAGAAEQALSYIGKLYLIERRLRGELKELKITEEQFVTTRTVSYTHLTLPTNREV